MTDMHLSNDSRETASHSRRRVVWSIAGFWTIYFLIASLRALNSGEADQLFRLIPRCIVTAVCVLLTFALHAALDRVRGSPLRHIVAAALLVVPAAFVYATVSWATFQTLLPFRPPSEAPDGPTTHLEPVTSLANSPGSRETITLGSITFPCAECNATLQFITDLTLNGYFIFFTWAGLHLALTYASELGALERKSAHLRAAAQAAQLRALRYQVNPHFLFNTLNSLSALVMSGRVEAADQMIVNLATFFRSSFTGDPTQDVVLADEIRMQQLYLAIETVRFPGRFTVEVRASDDAGAACVPGLILQPLVENCVKHGVMRTQAHVTIRIDATTDGDRLDLAVTDDAPAPIERNGPGIGLDNVRERLAARFGDVAACRHRVLPSGGFAVELSMPLIREGR